MRIALANTVNAGGGAAQAATRLLRALRERGTDATLLVQNFSAPAEDGVLGPSTLLERGLQHAAPLLEERYTRHSAHAPLTAFSPAIVPDLLARRVARLAPDVVHLHWVQLGMLRIESLRRLGPPVVWTLHDSWAFTGGCHVPFDAPALRPCTRHAASCGCCPVLRSTEERDLSRRVWRRKERSWRAVELTLVAPSRWIAEQAKASSLLSRCRVEHIPNGIDVTAFRPVARAAARELVGLPRDRRLVLFGAPSATTDVNKGFHVLVDALRALRARWSGEALELVVFGSRAPRAAQDLAFPATYVGWLHDEATRNALYAAADVLVVPSLLENLPFTVMESMAAGTPVVAFRQGGVPDLVDHLDDGYLARAYEPDDLAAGIAWVLADDARAREVSVRARRKIEQRFDVRRTADAHVRLYEELTASRRRA